MNNKIIIIGSTIMLIGCMSIPVFATTYSGASASLKKYGIITKTYQEELKITNKSNEHTISVTATVKALDSKGNVLGSDSQTFKVKMKELFTYSKTIKSGKYADATKGTYSYNIDSGAYSGSGTNYR